MDVAPPLFVLQVMEARRNLEWEQEHRASIRAHGTKDSGEAPGASTAKGEWALVPKQSTY